MRRTTLSYLLSPIASSESTSRINPSTCNEDFSSLPIKLPISPPKPASSLFPYSKARNQTRSRPNPLVAKTKKETCHPNHLQAFPCHRTHRADDRWKVLIIQTFKTPRLRIPTKWSSMVHGGASCMQVSENEQGIGRNPCRNDISDHQKSKDRDQYSS